MIYHTYLTIRVGSHGSIGAVPALKYALYVDREIGGIWGLSVPNGQHRETAI